MKKKIFITSVFLLSLSAIMMLIPNGITSASNSSDCCITIITCNPSAPNQPIHIWLSTNTGIYWDVTTGDDGTVPFCTNPQYCNDTHVMEGTNIDCYPPCQTNFVPSTIVAAYLRYTCGSNCNCSGPDKR